MNFINSLNYSDTNNLVRTIIFKLNDAKKRFLYYTKTFFLNIEVVKINCCRILSIKSN